MIPELCNDPSSCEGRKDEAEATCEDATHTIAWLLERGGREGGKGRAPPSRPREAA